MLSIEMLDRKAEGSGVLYIVEGDALHGLEVLLGVHLVQVAVCDEHGAVLHLVEAVDLVEAKQLISATCMRARTHRQTHTHTH